MVDFAPLFPLLIPSFSSKGNLLIPTEENEYISDNYDLLNVLDIRISKSYLLSAYDIYYKLMPQEPEDWPETEYLFIDSGGYETNDSFDLSERNKFNYKVFTWSIDKMEEVYKKISFCPKLNNTSIVLTVFDSLGTFDEQLKSALSLKEKFPNVLIDAIIKINFSIEDLIINIAKEKSSLNDIKIIGFTEKELGNTVKDRLLNLISIKRCLLNNGWSGHIHIFGGLEPNLIKMYYFAGADIFDGLSWQRIRFKNNSTLFDPSEYIISRTENENKYLMMLDNLAYLQKLSNILSISYDKRMESIIKFEKGLYSNELSINNILSILEV